MPGSVYGDESTSLKVDEIIVDSRQRIEHGEIERLAQSIRKHGQLQPIVVTRDKHLVVGERRLLAKKLLRHDWIDVIYAEDLSETEMKEIEFEENFHRKDLDWKERCRAVVEMFEINLRRDPKFNVTRLAEMISVSDTAVGAWLKVGQALVAGDEAIENASSLSAAYNIFERQYSRALDREVDDLDQALDEVLATTTPQSSASPNVDQLRETAAKAGIRTPRAASKDITCADFVEWAQQYDGPKFNLIHCDFPYGIDHQKSKQGSAIEHGAYDDSPETFWRLLNCLMERRSKLMSPNCHIVFWLSLNNRREVEDFFTAPIKSDGENEFKVDPFPLIWHKSDNTGILPDAQRGPRRVYEAALMIRRGDRKIVKPVSNLYPCPSRKRSARHLSEKPFEVVEYFLRMYVDGSTMMLDPTCGSGSSILAAETLGALKVVGVDSDPNCADETIRALNRLRTLGEVTTESEGGESDEVDG